MKWQPPGPISLAFMKCWDPVVGLMGPIGSGKTTTCLLKVGYFGALLQRPDKDGVRRWRCATIRDTYRQVWRATIPSWSDWFPRTAGEWTGSDGNPAKHVLTVPHPDGGPIELETNFLAIGDNQIEEVLRGYELSAIHLGEADLLHPNVLTYCRGRVGRYPKQHDGGCVWPGVVAEYNAPDIDNYLYAKFEEEKPEGHAFFRLPSGLSPQAENLKNLPPGYYDGQIHGNPDWYVRRMIRNEYGYSRDGKPVFEHEYNDDVHCAKANLDPIPGLPVQFGADAGGTPACVLGQYTPSGQWRVFDEIVADGGFCGPNRFGRLLVDALSRYPGIVIGDGRADPSAMFGADSGDGERNWILTLSEASKVRFGPASTNKLLPRLEAIRMPLTRMIDGGQPGLLISPRCRVLRKALNSGYRYRKMKTAGEDRFDTKPDKNEFSHVVDALQYLLLDAHFDHARGKPRDGTAKPRQQRAILDPEEDEYIGDRYRDAET